MINIVVLSLKKLLKKPTCHEFCVEMVVVVKLNYLLQCQIHVTEKQQVVEINNKV